MKTERHSCHSQAAVAAQIALLRKEWHHAMASTAAILQRARHHGRLAEPGLPLGSRPAIEATCR